MERLKIAILRYLWLRMTPRQRATWVLEYAGRKVGG